MKRFLVFLTLIVPALAFASQVQGADETIVVPADNKPFKVDENDLVRLTGKGIAGSKIEAVVTGPAKIGETSKISVRKMGMPVIGLTITEFEIQLTGKGKVTVQITVTSPQPDAKPEVTEYEFEVE